MSRTILTTATGLPIDLLDRDMRGLGYLATPYSKYPQGLEVAFRDAARLAARLLRQELRIYSPIAHTHPLAIHGMLDPLDHSLWLPFDEAMMERADYLLVAEMEGWRDSKGIAYEIAFFSRAGKSLYRVDPVTLRFSPFQDGGD